MMLNGKVSGLSPGMSLSCLLFTQQFRDRYVTRDCVTTHSLLTRLTRS